MPYIYIFYFFFRTIFKRELIPGCREQSAVETFFVNSVKYLGCFSLDVLRLEFLVQPVAAAPWSFLGVNNES